MDAPTPNISVDDLDVQVPIYYVIKRGVEPAEMACILTVLNLRQIGAAVVSRVEDRDLAFALAPEVINTKDDVTARLVARDIAIKTGRPLLVVGESPFVTAVYQNGKENNIAAEA